MSAAPLFSIKNPWFAISAGVTAAFAVFAAVIGLIVLPFLQPNLKLNGIWDAICSAAGVPQQWLRITAATPVPLTQTSLVAMTPQLLGVPSSASIGRGATLAMRCTMCHGAMGVSDANSATSEPRDQTTASAAARS